MSYAHDKSENHRPDGFCLPFKESNYILSEYPRGVAQLG